jgi:hypothetical protein
MGTRGLLRSVILALTLFSTGFFTAVPANADSSLLPMPATDSCGIASSANFSGSFPGGGRWTLRRLIVTTASTVTSGQALMTQNGATQPTEINIRANDATVGTSAWTIVGTLSQTGVDVAGSWYLVSYTGSVSLTPGIYWVGVRGINASTTSQLVCAVDNPAQSPWYVSTTDSPTWYSTNNNGSSYVSGTNSRANYISLSGSDSSTSPSEGASPPPSVLQQFRMPTGGTCAGAATQDLNWSAVTGGGWGESWAQWVNNGTGGAVCSRILVYSNALGRWVVG